MKYEEPNVEIIELPDLVTIESLPNDQDDFSNWNEWSQPNN